MRSLFAVEEVAARRSRRENWIKLMGYDFPPETVEAFHCHAEAQFEDRATRAIAIFKDFEAKHGKEARTQLELDTLKVATNDSTHEFLEWLEILIEERAG